MGLALRRGQGMARVRARGRIGVGRRPGAWLARVWARRPEPRVRFGQALLPGYPLLGPEDAAATEAILHEAEAIRAGRFSYEGRTVTMPTQVEWQGVGATTRWLAAHHRLEALLPVAVAAGVAPDGATRAAWYQVGATLVRAWLASVRVDQAPASDWTVAPRRISNLLCFHACFDDLLRSDGTLRATLLRSLYEQAETLAAGAAEAPADGWRVAAARALFLAGRVFDGLEAQAWHDQGRSLLWSELRMQVAEDGGHVRRSPAWQAFVLEEYAHVMAILVADHEEIPPWARKRLKGMCDVLWRTTHPEGTPVQLGEWAPRGRATAAELVSTMAGLLGEQGIAPSGPLTGSLPRLLLGAAGRDRFTALPRRRVRTESRAMRRTGFYVLAGQDGDAMVVDGGVPRRDELPFGYELAVGGLPLVVSSWDAGLATAAIGDYAASARSQNVLACLGRAASTVPASLAGADVHWMLRDGLASFVGTHGSRRRLVLCLPSRFWLVIDEVRGTEPWSGESFIHLHPDTEVRAHAHGRVTLELTRSRVSRATMAFAGASDVRVVGGTLGPRPQGWYVRGDGPPVPAPTVALTVGGALPRCCAYAFVPRTEQEVVLDLDHEPLRMALMLRVGRIEYRLGILQDEIELHSEIV